MTAEGSDLKPDGKHYDRYIRINHYCFRDDNYFYKERLPRDSNPSLMKKLYKDFNEKEDFMMIKFIQKNHPLAYKKIWKK